MNWTTFNDVKQQVMTVWDRGSLLAALVSDVNVFPLRLTLRKPTSTEIAEKFSAVRSWIAELRKAEEKGCRVVWRDVNHRVIGQNRLPDEIWIDTSDRAVSLIGKRNDAGRFAALLDETRNRHPELLPWLARCPLKALELAEDWSLLLDIVSWMRIHPRPNVYLRQVDIPGVHSKFIEGLRGPLAELLDLALPPETIQADANGVKNFCRRYGFREKATRVRFRILDTKLAVLSGGADSDITVNHDAFAQLRIPVQRVFITENEVNFLAFPPVMGSMVVFGAGYGFDMLAEAHWLKDCTVLYWGDLDTHGFAMLDQLRARFPHVESILMDQQTLLDHRCHWGSETQPEKRDLNRLTALETAVYDDLRHNRWGQHLRLEQERIGFSYLERTLEAILREA